MAKWGQNDPLTDKENNYAVFTVVSQFRMRYVVKMEDNDTLGNLADLVTCQVLDEFSQEHLGEVIVDSVCLSEESVLELFNKDNDYLKNWSDEYKLKWIDKLNKEPN